MNNAQEKRLKDKIRILIRFIGLTHKLGSLFFLSYNYILVVIN